MKSKKIEEKVFRNIILALLDEQLGAFDKDNEDEDEK